MMLKIIVALLVCQINFCLPMTAQAYENIWYADADAVRALDKIIVEPLHGEKNFASADAELLQKLLDKNKDIDFIMQRADENTATDANAARLEWSVRENRVQRDTSPAADFNVRMEAWTEVDGGPHVYGTRDRWTWYETYRVPETEVELHILRLDFALRKNEELLMTFSKELREYDTSEKAQFQNICKEFAQQLKQVRQNKFKTAALKVGEMSLPEEVRSDEYLARSLEFAVREEAGKIKAINASAQKYIVDGQLTYCAADAYWTLPSVRTSTYEVWRSHRSYTDSKGVKRYYNVVRYSTRVYGSPGYYVFRGRVSGVLNLRSAETGEILARYSAVKENDKVQDAYHALVRGLFKEAKDKI